MCETSRVFAKETLVAEGDAHTVVAAGVAFETLWRQETAARSPLDRPPEAVEGGSNSRARVCETSRVFATESLVMSEGDEHSVVVTGAASETL